MGVTRALPGHNPIVGVGAWIFRHRHAEVGPHLHALEDEIDTKTLLALHLPQVRPHVVFLAHAFLGPLERNAVVAGESLDPLVVLGRALAQDLLGNGADAVYVAEAGAVVFRAGEPR